MMDTVTEEELRALNLPATGVMGERDPEKKYLERLVGIVPGFRLYVIPGADHMQSGDALEWRHALIDHLKKASGKAQ